MFARAFCILLVATVAIASKDIGRVVDSILANYDKRARPDANVKPVDVKVEVAVLDVYNFDELNHQVTMSIYYREKWTDTRLSFDYNEVNQTKYFSLDAEQAKKIWIPDTFIANERSVVKHGFYTPNEFTRVYYNGNITRSVKLTVTVGCSLYLRWFPFDQNVCSLDFESYGHSMTDLRYEWARDSEEKPIIWISKETGQSVRHETVAFRGTDYKIDESTGKYARVALQLYLKRFSFRYVLDVYFPATAIPIVAFITLCVGPLHFRVLLSTICMGIMVVYSAILMLLTPKVDYKTALDFYVFNSSVTVFNVVLVNFFMYYLLKPKVSQTQIRMRQLNGSNEEGKGILSEEDGVEEAAAAGSSGGQPRFPSKTSELLYKFCEKSYLTMPIFFVIFNIIYWPVVLIASSGVPFDFVPVEQRST